MRFQSFSRRIGVAAVVAFAAACSDSASPTNQVSDSQATADLAISAGNAIATDVGLLVGGETLGMGITFSAARDHGSAGLLAIPAGCTQGTDGRYTCTTTTANGLTLTRSFAFYDVAGVIQDRFDATTTASINFQNSISGTVTHDGGTGTISRQRDMTLSGLAGAETQRTWNGTGTGTRNFTHTGDRGTRTYAETSNDTTSAVVFNVPRADNPWPQSGTVVHNMTATATVEGTDHSGSRTFSRRAVVTFNGTANVPLQVGTRSCTLNLETKHVTCPAP